MVPAQDEDAAMTRLRSSAATARQARLRSSAATARQARLRSSAATARQARLRRFVATATLVVLAGSGSLLACPMCFGAEETPLIDGAKLGILVMLGITFVVQGGFVAFFLYLRKRARQAADIELETEWSELQRSRT
jgi:hypothetical protein